MEEKTFIIIVTNFCEYNLNFVKTNREIPLTFDYSMATRFKSIEEAEKVIEILKTKEHYYNYQIVEENKLMH